MNEDEKRRTYEWLHEHGKLRDERPPDVDLAFLANVSSVQASQIDALIRDKKELEAMIQSLEHDLWEQHQTPLESHPMIPLKIVAGMISAFVGGYLIGSAGNHVARLHKWLNG